MATTTPAGNIETSPPPPPLLPIAVTTTANAVVQLAATAAPAPAPTTPAATPSTTLAATAQALAPATTEETSDSKRAKPNSGLASPHVQLIRRGQYLQISMSRYNDMFIDRIVVVPIPSSVSIAPSLVASNYHTSGASITILRNNINCMALVVLPSAVTLYEFKFPYDALHNDVLKAVYADVHGFGCRATMGKGFGLPEYIVWCSTGVTNYGNYKSLTDDMLTASITKSYVGSTVITSRRPEGSDMLSVAVNRGNSPSQVAALESAKKHLPTIEIPSACIHRIAPISSVETIVAIPSMPL